MQVIGTSSPMSAETNALLKELLQVGAIKFGKFTLKSGITSPVYVDLRILPSYPKLLSQVCELMWRKFSSKPRFICGVPYSALIFATCISVTHSVPMVTCRKEAKKYGTKNQVEGVFEKGDECVVLEDVITSGSSLLTCAKNLESAGLKVKRGIVFLDREQGGIEAMRKQGIEVTAVFKLSEIVKYLKADGMLNDELEGQILGYLEKNKAVKKVKELTYKERASLTKCEFAKQLFELMESKKTNLCVAVDVTSKKELLEIANELGPEICMLKTHIDTISDFDWDLVEKLQGLAEKHKFFIFEDRKFADIGNTVQLQYTQGIYQISKWAHLTNCHLVSGSSIVTALKQVGLSQGRGLLLIAEMSSKDSAADAEHAVQVAQEHKDFVAGFICQKRLSENLGFVYCTPGVNLGSTGDSLGQRYNTPEEVVKKKKSDVIIVGRGVYLEKDRVGAAKKYRKAGWNAYLERLKE